MPPQLSLVPIIMHALPARTCPRRAALRKMLRRSAALLRAARMGGRRLQAFSSGSGSSSSAPVPITVAYGDGIGPEIMTSTMEILGAAGARIEPEVIEVGEKLYRSGLSSGIADASWDSLRRTKVSWLGCLG